MSAYTLDERDLVIIARRADQVAARLVPSVGDFVIFADRTTRRISYVWDWDDGDTHVQTSDEHGGSYYLGDEYVSYSGGLYTGVAGSTLTPAGVWREGRCWIFHHDYMTAHNGVDTVIPFRVWVCSEQPTT